MNIFVQILFLGIALSHVALQCLCVLQGWVRDLESSSLFSMLSLHSLETFQPGSPSVLSFSSTYLVVSGTHCTV